MNTHRIRIVLADDHPVVRDGLSAMLGTEPDLEVVAEASDGESAVRQCLRFKHDIVLLDIELPDFDGLEVARRILERAPTTGIIIFTAFDSEERALRAVRAGVQGYLLKGTPREELFRTVRAVHAGESVVQGNVAARLLRRMTTERRPELTERQLEVLRLLAEGQTNKEIALAPKLRERTVKYHLAAIFDRLGAGKRTEALSLALRHGLVRQAGTAAEHRSASCSRVSGD